ncbi:MAG: polysaccharide deacetylase family protein [Chloroflexi bacterium]|nr:polysaccharide deacetylase family protein [Chloroflexota bacterium]
MVTITPTAAPPEPAVARNATPNPEFIKLPPNELGKVMILSYHMIGEPEQRWQRTPDNFRNDLERLYQAGYRLLSLRDFLDNNITTPAGFSPVILTLDDSSPGQFRYTDKGQDVEIDPNSAAGILVDFAKKHPDFGLEATFFVLPEGAPPDKLFGQPKYEQRKLQQIVDLGMDLGNHTWWHQPLGEVSDEEVQMQLAFAVKSVKEAVPGYEMDVVALPLGSYPKNRALAFAGEYKGYRYKNRAVLLAGEEPAASPNRNGYDALALPRIQATQDQLDLWFGGLAKNPAERYVSDGDPNTITFSAAVADQLDEASPTGNAARKY